jgi:hypothetical protein
MELTENQLADALDALTEDGDRYSFATSRWEFELRLTIEHDDDAHINHYDCYGKASKFSYRYWDGPEPRPDDMDGSARKIQVDRGDYVWWQPPADMTSAKRWGGPPEDYPEVFRTFVQQVTDLLQWGFSIVGLHVWQHLETAHGDMRWVEIDSTYVGGVDSTDAAHISDLVSDLIADLADIS